MTEWKFTREYVPGFIYLMDQIIKDDFYKVQGNIYIRIATDGVSDNEEIDDRTIRRAFDLRKQLNREIPTSKKISKPSLFTLNVITSFYFEEKPDTFLGYLDSSKDDIAKYYGKAKPSEELLDMIFKKLPEKITNYEKYISELEELLAVLKDTSLEDFVQDAGQAQMADIAEGMNENETRQELESFIQEHIATSEKKLKKAALLYRFLGGFGLLFVTTPQFSDLKTYVIEAFIDEQEDDFEITDEDDLDDDLMDAAL